MDPEIPFPDFKLEFEGEELTFTFGRYGDNNRIACQIYTPSEPFGKLTVNVPEIPLAEDMFILDRVLLDVHPKLIKLLEKEKRISNCDVRVSYGYVEDQPVYRFLAPE